jgi:hypothetical protein
MVGTSKSGQAEEWRADFIGIQRETKKAKRAKKAKRPRVFAFFALFAFFVSTRPYAVRPDFKKVS